MQKYKSVFISDIHLGTRSSQPKFLLDFLKTFESENLFLIGDIVDGWALEKSFYWPQSHNDVIQKLLKKARKGTNVFYITGNHDEFLRPLGEHSFGNIKLLDSYVYKSVSGTNILVIHGDQFDVVMQNVKWLAHIGSWAYDVLLGLNLIVSKIRRLFKLPHWSLSAWAKYKVKQAVNFISGFEENLVNYAKTKGAGGVICGHIHHPNIRSIDNVLYLNTGDWIESCSAIVEHLDGKWELILWDTNYVS